SSPNPTNARSATSAAGVLCSTASASGDAKTAFLFTADIAALFWGPAAPESPGDCDPAAAVEASIAFRAPLSPSSPSTTAAASGEPPPASRPTTTLYVVAPKSNAKWYELPSAATQLLLSIVNVPKSPLK